MQSNKSLLALAASVLIITPAAALGQTSVAATGPLEEIVVTSSAIPLPLRRIGTSVAVLTAADIEARGNLALTDVLRQMPAISASGTGGAGKAMTLRIRGEEGYRTLTILDGIRLLDPSGPQIGPQLEHVLSSGVARVEILRGPQGLSYGADAGGVVNISTRRSEQGLQLDFDAQSGSFDTRQLTAGLGAGNALGDVSFTVADYATDGFNALAADTVLQDADGYANTTLHARGGLNISERVRLELVHRDVDSTAATDGCFLAVVEHSCSALFAMQASRAALSYSGDAATHSLAFTDTRSKRDSLVLDTSTFPTLGELTRVEYLGSTALLPYSTVVFGADHEEALNNGRGRHNLGVFAEYLSDFSDSLFVAAGLRHDDNDDFGSHSTYRVSGAYVVELSTASTLKFRASHGTGFRAPSPYEIAYNRGAWAYPPAALVTLRQERSAGNEAGVEYLHGSWLQLDAVVFSQKVEDAIYFDLGTYSGYLQDIGTSTSRGVEVAAEASLGKQWRLQANFTWNDTERPNGLQRPRRPKHLLNLGAGWHSSDDRLQINAFWRAARGTIDDVGANVLAVDDFAVLDLSAAFDLNAEIQVYARLENLLDEHYQEVIGYNTAGRAAYVGVRLQYR